MTNQGTAARERGAHPLHGSVTYSYWGFLLVTGFSTRDKKMSREEKKRGGGTVRETYDAERNSAGLPVRWDPKHEQVAFEQQSQKKNPVKDGQKFFCFVFFWINIHFFPIFVLVLGHFFTTGLN